MKKNGIIIKIFNMINDEEYVYTIEGNNFTNYLVHVTDDLVVVYTHDEKDKEKDKQHSDLLK